MSSKAGEPIIKVRDVRKLYRLGGEEVWALKGVSMDIHRGEFISIMGPSGSGKSTLFNQIGALDIPTEGRVTYEGNSIFDMPEEKQAAFRCRKIGYIFQTFNLIEVMTSLQNVMLPMTLLGVGRDDAAKKAASILERVGLGHRLGHRPQELSGGQQQRVAIARSLANNPEVILADEPTGNLDTRTGQEIVDLLNELNRKDGVTVICSTHDPKMLQSSERVHWMRDGILERTTSGEQASKTGH